MGAPYELHPQPRRRDCKKRGAVRMTTLEDLWYGNIRPVENYVEGNAEYKSLLRLVSKNRETLENELSHKQC